MKQAIRFQNDILSPETVQAWPADPRIGFSKDRPGPHLAVEPFS